MNMTSLENLKAAMDANIPIVSCFRSNAFFNVFNLRNYSFLSNYDAWLIGTDNVMISTPDLISEMRFASYFIKKDRELFCAATRGFEVFSRNNGLILFHTKGNLHKISSIRSVVRRANAMDILKILYKELVLD